MLQEVGESRMFLGRRSPSVPGVGVAFGGGTSHPIHVTASGSALPPGSVTMRKSHVQTSSMLKVDQNLCRVTH